jgi:type IV pilus assembly protein PilN
MAKTAFNIEISDRIIKVCEIGNKKNLLISRCFMFLTPEGSVTDGQIIDPEALAAALKKEFKRHRLRCKNANLALVSGRVAVREVVFPPVKENRLKSLVESNASDYFPVDMSKYHITHTILESVKKGENQGHRVMIMAVPLTLLEGYVTLASLAGFQINSIDYFGNSQFRAVENKGGTGITMLINVDCTYTCITFIQGKKLLLQRFLTTGVDELIQNYIAASGRLESEYMLALDELSSGLEDTIEAILPRDSIEDSLSRLISNINRVSDHFSSKNWDHPVEKIILTGACCHVTGLQELLSEESTIPFEALKALPGFSSLSTAKITDISNYFSCVGSAVAPVDFIPPQSKKKKKKKDSAKAESSRLAVLFLVGCILISAGLSVSAYFNYLDNLQEKNATQENINNLSYVQDTYQAYVNYENGITDVKALTDLSASPNDNLLAFIDDLENKMPSDIRVLSAACTTTGVNMNVTVSSKEAAAEVIVELRSFDSISQVEVGAIAEFKDDSGVKTVSFTVNCIYTGSTTQNATASAAGASSASATTAAASSSTTSAAQTTTTTPAT